MTHRLEAKLHEQVNGEWSLVETVRHLLFARDAWLGSSVLQEEAPYHPFALPAGGSTPDAAAKLRLTLEATPRSTRCSFAARPRDHDAAGDRRAHRG